MNYLCIFGCLKDFTIAIYHHETMVDDGWRMSAPHIWLRFLGMQSLVVHAWKQHVLPCHEWMLTFQWFQCSMNFSTKNMGRSHDPDGGGFIGEVEGEFTVSGKPVVSALTLVWVMSDMSMGDGWWRPDLVNCPKIVSIKCINSITGE